MAFSRPHGRNGRFQAEACMRAHLFVEASERSTKPLQALDEEHPRQMPEFLPLVCFAL
jgi:hypothetical protein